MATLEHIPAAEYRARPGINASSIVAGRLSLRHMQYEMTRTENPSTPGMRMGTLGHSAVLEPDDFAGRIDVVEYKRGAAWADAKDRAGEFAITGAELSQLMQISGAVHANQAAHKLIADTEHEVSVFWDEQGIGPCKARMDAYAITTGVVDVKTTQQMERRAFVNVCARLGYHIKMAWYRRAAFALTGQTVPVHLIVIEQGKPHDTAVYRMRDMDLDLGDRNAIAIASAYANAERVKLFPGVSPGVSDLAMPDWLHVEDENTELPSWVECDEWDESTKED